MQQLQPRREVWELGFLPLQALCPQLEGPQALLGMHAKLLERSTCTPSGQWVISASEVASVMELTSTQQEILAEVLGALSVLNSSGGGAAGAAAAGGTADGGGRGPSPPPLPGQELLFTHELSLFMFVQLFSKESQQRAESLEVWPEAGPPTTSLSPGMDGLLSPTRAMTVRTSLSGKASLRQQLQQHLRHQTQQLRGLGDYLRRNLKTLVELCLDTAPPAPSPSNSVGASLAASGAAGAAAQQQQAAAQRPVKALEVDRLRFVLTPSSGMSGGGFGGNRGQESAARQPGVISSLLPGLTVAGTTWPVETVVASLRQVWFEEILQSPRVGASSPAGNWAAGLMLSPVAKASRHLGLVAPSGQVDEASIGGVYKGTVVRGEADVPQGHVRITDCHDAVIYLLAPLQTAYVSACSDTTVVVGAAGGLVRIERCEKLTLIAAAARVLVSSCHDCLLHLGTPRPPLLVGDCRFIRLAPFNTRYERQLAHCASAGLRLDCPNKWDSPLVLVPKERPRLGSSGGTPDSPRAAAGPHGPATSIFSLPGAGGANSAGHSPAPSSGGGAGGGGGGDREFARSGSMKGLTSTTFSLLQPEELLPFVVPFQGASGTLAGGPAPPHTTAWKHMAAAVSRSSAAAELSGSSGGGGMGAGAGGAGGLYLFPLPAEYERALHRKLAMTGELRARFRQAALTKDRETELNNAIQAYFKDWLSSSNMLRQIYDLSNLEKDEGAPLHLVGPSHAPGGPSSGGLGGGAGGSGGGHGAPLGGGGNSGAGSNHSDGNAGSGGGSGGPTLVLPSLAPGGPGGVKERVTLSL